MLTMLKYVSQSAPLESRLSNNRYKEYSLLVTRVGDEVTRVRVGDEVIR